MSQYLFRLALSADSSLRIDRDFWLWSLPILSMSHDLFHSEPLVESHWGRAEIPCPVGQFVASDWARPLSPLVTVFFTTGGYSACGSVELEGSDD